MASALNTTPLQCSTLAIPHCCNDGLLRSFSHDSHQSQGKTLLKETDGAHFSTKVHWLAATRVHALHQKSAILVCHKCTALMKHCCQNCPWFDKFCAFANFFGICSPACFPKPVSSQKGKPVAVLNVCNKKFQHL